MLNTITHNPEGHTWVWPRQPAQWLVSIVSALLISGLIFAGTASADTLIPAPPSTVQHVKHNRAHADRAWAIRSAYFAAEAKRAETHAQAVHDELARESATAEALAAQRRPTP